MRSAPRWGWRCSPRSPPPRRPPGAGSRPATGTASPSWPPSPPGSPSSPCSPCRPCGPGPAPGWRCTEMAEQRAAGYQRAIAERNVEAIVDAVEDLLELHGQASISAVAAQAGVSRVTVYAHFPTWEALLEAAVDRAVRRTMTALEAAEPKAGPPVQALERMLAAAWRHLARYSAMAQAVAEQLDPEAVARTHQAAHRTVGALLERGRADGSFRTDLPAAWLVTCCITLIHACAQEVRAGRIGDNDAVGLLTVTVRDLFTGPSGRTPG